MIPKYNIGDEVIALYKEEDDRYFLLYTGFITTIVITNRDVAYQINGTYNEFKESQIMLKTDYKKLLDYIETWSEEE